MVKGHIGLENMGRMTQVEVPCSL